MNYMDHKPLKRFGQNYLVDDNTINKIISRFDPHKSDEVIEIGPGRGALTEKLIESCDEVTAIEIDDRVIEDLSLRFPSLKLINIDFLKSDLKDVFKNRTNLRVFGNIPYNITSPIIFKLIDNRELLSDAMLMVQLEMAQRMTAEIGTKEYGVLNVILNAFAHIDLCFKISPNVFYPKPHVYSSLVHLKFNKEFPKDINPETFISVVKAAFANRRKTLKNSFKNSIFALRNFEDDDRILSKRAEQLDVNEFYELTRKLERCLYG